MSECPAVPNGRFGSWVKEVTVICIVGPHFSLYGASGLWVNAGVLRGHLVPHPLSPNGCSVHVGRLPEMVTSLRVAGWWCPNCIISCPFIRGPPSMKKSF